MNWTAETNWPIKKKALVFSRKNSGTIICNFLYWQAESYVSFHFRFWIDRKSELPPRQGTEAAGSLNATANTRTAQKFFKLNLRLIIINLKIFYRILVDHPPTETDQTTPTASKKEKKKIRKKIGRLHCLSFKFFILTNLNDGNKKFDYFCIGTCIIVQSIPCLRHNITHYQ